MLFRLALRSSTDIRKLGCMTDQKIYEIDNANELLTPCLLVYPELIQQNLEAAIQIAGNAQRLRPHVKTHKTAEIVQMELELGITKHKCATLAEAQMLAECGVPDVFIAYQQVGPATNCFANLVARYSQTLFSVVVEDEESAKHLETCLAEKGLVVDVLIDIDTGMHRTGTVPGNNAIELYRRICESPQFRPGGLHVYDGQNHQPLRTDRDAAVGALMEPVLRLVDRLQERGLNVPKLVCGGTPTFPVYAQVDLPGGEPHIELSPGTCVLSDYNYGKDYQDLSSIVNAAVLMTRVISKQHENHITVDLGNKAVAADPPAGSRCHFLGLPDAKEVKQNEEHLIVQTSKAKDLEVGDVLYVLPAHICPTVALHESLQVIRDGRRVESWRVTARHRLYEVIS